MLVVQQYVETIPCPSVSVQTTVTRLPDGDLKLGQTDQRNVLGVQSN